MADPRTRVPVWQQPPPRTSPWRESPFFRPLVCIAIILVALCILVVLLSRPAKAWLALEARCDSLDLPVAAVWTFPAPDSLTAFWTEAKLENIENLSLNGASDPRTALDLTIGQPDSSRPPSFLLQPGSQRTQLTVRGTPGTRLAVVSDSPGTRVEWHHTPAGSWSADLSFFEARFESNHLAGSPSLSGRIRNQMLPAGLRLSSRPAPDVQLPAYLASPAPANFSWSIAASDLPQLKAISASGCRLSPPRSDASGIAPSSGQKESLNMQWESVRSLSVTLDAPDKDPALHIQANGEISSLREAGRELLPSLFEQLARGAPEQRGFLGVSAALLVLAAGLYLKRALEILAKLHLPDPK